MTHFGSWRSSGSAGRGTGTRSWGRSCAGREGEDLGVHLVQVHVPRDGLRLEGPRVHRSARLQLGLAAAGLDRLRDGAVEVGLGLDALAGQVELVDVVDDVRRRGRGDHERERAAGDRAAARARAAHEPHPAGAGQHADQRGGQRDVAQVAGEARLGHRPRRRSSARCRSPPSPASGRPAGAMNATARRRTPAPADVDGRAEHRAQRLKTSMNGCAAKAALSGLGLRARAAARRKSPEPRYSGTNHRTPRPRPPPITSAIVLTGSCSRGASRSRSGRGRRAR